MNDPILILLLVCFTLFTLLYGLFWLAEKVWGREV